MKVLTDTSVLVSALLPSHAFHSQSVPWLARAKQRAFDWVVSAHSLAELFAVLTRMPSKPKLSPAASWTLIDQNIIPFATIESLTGRDYQDVVHALAQQGLAGGIVFDALIARVAEIAQVDNLVTLNETHFLRVWPAGGSRIVSPRLLSPP